MGAQGVPAPRGGRGGYQGDGSKLQGPSVHRHLLRRYRLERPHLLRLVLRRDGRLGRGFPPRAGQPRHDALLPLARAFAPQIRDEVRPGLLLVQRGQGALRGARRQLLRRPRVFLHRLHRRAAVPLARDRPVARREGLDRRALHAHPLDLHRGGPQDFPLRDFGYDAHQPRTPAPHAGPLQGAHLLGPYAHDLQRRAQREPLRACDSLGRRSLVAGRALHRRHPARLQRVRGRRRRAALVLQVDGLSEGVSDENLRRQHLPRVRGLCRGQHLGLRLQMEGGVRNRRQALCRARAFRGLRPRCAEDVLRYERDGPQVDLSLDFGPLLPSAAAGRRPQNQGYGHRRLRQPERLRAETQQILRRT